MTDRCPKYEPDALAKFGAAEDENCQTCLHKEDPYCGPVGATDTAVAPDELQKWDLDCEGYIVETDDGGFVELVDHNLVAAERNELRDANTYLTDTCETQRKIIDQAREVIELLQVIGYADESLEKIQKWLDDERAGL